MTISASWTVICDDCGTDAGASRPTQTEAIEYAQRGGWTVNEIAGFLDRPHGYALCEDCQPVQCNHEGLECQWSRCWEKEGRDATQEEAEGRR